MSSIQAAPTRPVRSPVAFAPGDHAGFMRRLIATAIDVVVSVLAMMFTTIMIIWLEPPAWVLTAAPLAVVVGYLVFLKRSRVRTLGYRMAGVRIVNAYGEPPSAAVLLFRVCAGLFLFSIGNVNNMDYLTLTGRGPRGKLSDIISGTRVVRSDALSTGPGEFVTAYYFLAATLVVREVRAKSSPKFEAV